MGLPQDTEGKEIQLSKSGTEVTFSMNCTEIGVLVTTLKGRIKELNKLDQEELLDSHIKGLKDLLQFYEKVDEAMEKKMMKSGYYS
jgi:hypothetical protein